MVSYRYLGSALTNANGVATFDYQGTGAGEIDVIASLDKPIVDGSIVSETYSVIDGVFYDDGVTSPKTATWYNQSSAFTLTPSDEGTLVSASTSSLQSLLADGTTFSNSYKYDSKICVEFDLISADNNFIFAILGDNNTSITCSVSQTGHYKIYYDGEKQYKYLNGELIETPSVRTLTPNCAVGFRINGTGTIKFKNFVIYPI